MKASLQNFKVTAIVGLFTTSTAFLLNQIILYDLTNLCEDSNQRLPCSFDIFLLFLQLIFAIFTLLLSMLACCYNTRTLGFIGFFAALIPGFLNFIYLLVYVSSDFYASLPSSLSQPVIAAKLQTSAFWVALSIGFFSLHVAPSLFSEELSPKLDHHFTPPKPATVKEERKESDEEDFEAQVSKELGKHNSNQKGSVATETPRSQRSLMGNRSPLSVRQFLHSGTSTNVNRKSTTNSLKSSKTGIRGGKEQRWVG